VNRLRPGDQLRIVTPAGSLDGVPTDVRRAAVRRLVDQLGLVVTFGGHVDEGGPLGAGSIAGRVADLHAAFTDPDVAGVLSVDGPAVGGTSASADLSVQLLPHLDWDLLAAHPTVFCATATLSALGLALTTATGQISYLASEPAVFAAGGHGPDAAMAEFRKCVLTADPGPWQPDGDGWWLMQPGTTPGPVVGGEIGTLALLRGVGRLPDLDGAVLLVRPGAQASAAEFVRDLTVLLQAGSGSPGNPAGLVIGAFPESAGMTRPRLAHTLATTPELATVPVLANVEIGPGQAGHPVPIGGVCWLAADPGATEIILTRH
jgi:muramoyltetrapeptide carboxypeptidase